MIISGSAGDAKGGYKTNIENCASCERRLTEEQMGDQLIQYSCGQGHCYSLCGNNCRRLFEKRCVKARTELEKMLNRLKNNGNFQFRQMPRLEREKLMHLKEAETTGAMNCPFEIKSTEKAHPHCSLVMKCIAPQDDMMESYASGSTQDIPDSQMKDAMNSLDALGAVHELLDDDKLEVLQKEDDKLDEEQEEAPQPSKKGKKAKKQKQVLDIDVKFAPRGQYWEWYSSSSAKAAPAPPKTVAPPSWAAEATQPVQPVLHQSPPSWAKDPNDLEEPPQNARELIQNLVELTACSESQALQLLRSHRWNIEASADAFYAWGAKNAYEAQKAALEPEAYPPKSLLSRIKNHTDSTIDQYVSDERHEYERAHFQQPEDFFNHVEALNQQASLAPHDVGRPSVPSLPDEWEAVWSSDDNAYYFWHIHTGETQWEPPAQSVQEPHAVTSASFFPHEQPIDFSNLPAMYLCTTHWEPDAAFSSAIRILLGDLIRVSWTDGEKDGWAFGNIIGDEVKEGYFPQQFLSLATRQPLALTVGRRYFVGKNFQGPPNTTGYLSVQPKSVIQVAYQSQSLTWCYAMLIESDRKGVLRITTYGWIPECVVYADRVVREQSPQNGHSGLSSVIRHDKAGFQATNSVTTQEEEEYSSSEEESP